MRGTVLLVDDDPTLLRFLREYMEREGYTVLTAERGQQGLRLFYDHHPDLVVLDVMMPGMDGWEVCARLRELAEIPVIMLTAKTSEADKLRGFRMGVDDFVTKPFSLAELAARVRAVLGRTQGDDDDSAAVLRVGPLDVDVRKHEVRLDGRALEMTPTEFRLLSYLASRAGEAVSQETLVDEVWGEDRQGGASAVRRYIWFLRRKIEADPDKPQRLVTVRGFGYRLEG